MKLLESTEKKINKDLEITAVFLVHCNVVNNYYQQNSRALYAFVPDKYFGQFLGISPKYLIFLKTFNSEFSYIEVWFTDQNEKPLEMEYKINITLVIIQSVTFKK